MSKTLQHLFKGYLLFNVNGKTFKTYGGALKESQLMSGDVLFTGKHITKGWVVLYKRYGTPLWNKRDNKLIDRKPKKQQSTAMQDLKKLSFRQWILIIPRILILLPIVLISRIVEILSFWLKSFEDYMDRALS
jgi:hypothetical protein